MARGADDEPRQGADPLVRNNVRVLGDPDGRPLVFAHAFGGSQDSWRFVVPAFEDDFRIVLFDNMGAGASDLTAYEPAKYDSLHGYADDVIEMLDVLGLTQVAFVGHSVSAMIGILAANRRPDLFAQLILVGPSPRYIDATGYFGGFSAGAIDDLLTSLDANYLNFSASLAPVLMGNPERPELSDALAESIRSSDQRIASQFARATFLSDNRRDLADVTVPTLILQSAEDNIAGMEVGRYVHERIPGSRFVVMSSRGHIPNLSDPEELSRHIREALS